MDTGKAPSLPSLGSHFQIPDLFLAPKLPARRARTALAARPLTQMEIGGLDSDGREFRNADEMWREEVGDGDHQKKSQWYNKGINYWEVSSLFLLYVIYTRSVVGFCLYRDLFNEMR